jgi:hypothetical protein
MFHSLTNLLKIQSINGHTSLFDRQSTNGALFTFAVHCLFTFGKSGKYVKNIARLFKLKLNIKRTIIKPGNQNHTTLGGQENGLIIVNPGYDVKLCREVTTSKRLQQS